MSGTSTRASACGPCRAPLRRSSEGLVSSPVDTKPDSGPLRPHPLLTRCYADEAQRRKRVGSWFDKAAPDYDWINQAISFGSGGWYRGQALARAGSRRDVRPRLRLGHGRGRGPGPGDRWTPRTGGGPRSEPRDARPSGAAGSPHPGAGRGRGAPVCERTVRLPLHGIRAAARARPACHLPGVPPGAQAGRPAPDPGDHASPLAAGDRLLKIYLRKAGAPGRGLPPRGRHPRADGQSGTPSRPACRHR